MGWKGGFKKKASKKKVVQLQRPKPVREFFDAVVPRSLVEQAEAFTAPRGHLEMGGLLIGHVDDKGRNVCAVGFFPEQIEATAGYCEFDGSWLAMSAAAIDHANSAVDGDSEDTPKLRVIGWIHTHPGLGIFLSGIDVRTYEDNLNMTKDGRFVAVVVDPLEGKDGVFLTPDKPNSHSPATGTLSMDDKLRARYLAFLQRMEEIREARGREALPFLLCGDLRGEHVSKGNVDDYLESYLKGIHNIRKEFKSWKEGFDSESRRIGELEVLIGQNEGVVGALHDEMHSMDREIGERLDKMEQRFTDSIVELVESFKSRISEMEKSIEELATHEEQSEETEVSEADLPPAVGLDLSEYWIVLGVA